MKFTRSFLLSRKLLTLSVLALSLAVPSNAQKPGGINFDATYLQDGTYVFGDTLTYMQDELFTTYKAQFGLGENDEMRLEQAVDVGETGPNIVGEGHFYSRYSQYYKGYKVEGAHMNVLGQHDVALRASGFIMKKLATDVSRPISEDQALNIALNYIGATSYNWQDTVMEEELKERNEDPTATNYPRGTLSIRRIQGGTGAGDYKLTWLFTIDATAPAGHYSIVVDAINRTVIDSLQDLDGAQWRWGTVNTWYNGTQSIETSTCNLCTRFTLYSPPSHRSHGGMYNNSHNTWADAKDNNNNWSATEDTRTVATAYWISDVARNYYVNKHGRWGSNYNGKTVQLIANFGALSTGGAGLRPSVTDVDQILMAPDNGHPVSTLGIIGHEMSHAYINFHSAVGNNDHDFDACSIREGFADIFGELVERSYTGTMDWNFGNDCNVFNRHFNTPHTDFPYPASERYLDPGYWYYPVNNPANDAYGWYTNSGLLRRWFYRLSTRTTAPAGVGIDLADNIAYYTVNWWIWSNLRWTELAKQSIAEAAYDFGQCSKEHKAVMQSWVDVGLYSTPRPCMIISPSSVDAVKTGIHFTTFTITPRFNTDDIPTGGTYNFVIPRTWTGYRDGNNFVVTGISDKVTRKFQVTYTAPDGTSYAGERIVHVIDELPAAHKNSLSGNDMQANSFKLYPNPANNFIKIDLQQSITNGQFEICDLLGKVLVSGPLAGKSGNIDVQKLSAGSYFFTIKADNYKETKHFEIISK